MARVPRNAYADCHFFHAYARGVDSLPIFRDRIDRLVFMELLASATEREGWSCHAFCLMTTHAHVVVETAVAHLSRGMHHLLGVYASYFNRRHGRHGHLFGDRFGARAIDDEEYMWTAVEYVLQNPVRAGLVRVASDWPWAGARDRPAHAADAPRSGPKPPGDAGRLLLRAP